MFRRLAKKILGPTSSKKKTARPSASSIQRPRYNERADEAVKQDQIISNGIEVSGSEVLGWQDAGKTIHILDIREPHERTSGVIDGALCIPMNSVPHRLDELPTDGHLVVYCAAGVRSLSVVDWLKRNGFPNASSLIGGVGALIRSYKAST